MVGKDTLTSPVYTPETGKNECGVTRMRARKLGFAALSMLASLLQSQDRQVHFKGIKLRRVPTDRRKNGLSRGRGVIYNIYVKKYLH